MQIIDIASNLAWIKCTHKEMGMPGCLPCLKRYEKTLIDDIEVEAVVAAAKYLEPAQKLTRITPLTWVSAYEITKVIINAVRRLDGIHR